MFETAVSYGPPSHRVWTTFMGMTGQAILLACAIAIPLWFPAALPRMQAPVTWLTAPELPPAPAPPAAPVVRTAPPAASAAPPRVRIGGVVELEGVVGVDGRIRELKAKSGHPLLIRAAMDAVAQWLFRPTTLNGEPVEIVQPVVVRFNLK